MQIWDSFPLDTFEILAILYIQNVGSLNVWGGLLIDFVASRGRNICLNVRCVFHNEPIQERTMHNLCGATARH